HGIWPVVVGSGWHRSMGSCISKGESVGELDSNKGRLKFAYRPRAREGRHSRYLSASRSCGTLVNALLWHCRNLSGIGGKERLRGSFARAWNGFMSTLLERVDEALRGHR